MRKICFLIDSIFTFGGVQRVTAVIAKELAKDHDVTVVTFDKPSQKDLSLYGLHSSPITYHFFSYPPVSSLKNLLCKAYSAIYKTIRPNAPWASDLYAHSSFPSELRKTLAAELAGGGYDVIIGVHAPLASRLATMRAWLPQARLIGWIHNSFEALFGEASTYIGPALKRHYVYQFRKLDATVLLCQHDAETYRQYDSRLKPTVIYNPLTLSPGDPSKGDSNRFLAVGRFSHLHKGFDLLIEAFHLFAQRNAEWRLDIVGEGPEEPLYRQLIAKYQLGDRVTLHPFTNRIQTYYSSAQVYVLSSRWEGFGLVLVEAMAHGLPIVSSDLPTSQEIMGDFGLYFRNGDIQDLADQLEKATRLDWQRASGEAVTIAKRFDIGNIINQWKQIID